MTAADRGPDPDAAPDPGPGVVRGGDLTRLLRWYPRAWRERYGDEFLAMVEDTLDGCRPGWQLHLSVAKAGLRERGRRAAPAALRKLADDASLHQSFDLVGWSTLIALIYFWSGWNGVQIPLGVGVHRQAGRAVPVAVGALAGLGAVICVSVTIAGLVAGPTLVRFLRAGGWPGIRPPAVRAAVATLAFAGTLTRFLMVSSTYRHPTLWGAFTLWFFATFVLLEVTLRLWKRTVRAMLAQQFELRPRVRAIQLMLNAVTLSASLAVLPVMLIWTGQAYHSDWIIGLALLVLVGRSYTAPYRLWRALPAVVELRAG